MRIHKAEEKGRQAYKVGATLDTQERVSLCVLGGGGAGGGGHEPYHMYWAGDANGGSEGGCPADGSGGMSTN
jgi:hypothetical protein